MRPKTQNCKANRHYFALLLIRTIVKCIAFMYATLHAKLILMNALKKTLKTPVFSHKANICFSKICKPPLN